MHLCLSRFLPLPLWCVWLMSCAARGCLIHKPSHTCLPLLDWLAYCLCNWLPELLKGWLIARLGGSKWDKGLEAVTVSDTEEWTVRRKKKPPEQRCIFSSLKHQYTLRSIFLVNLWSVTVNQSLLDERFQTWLHPSTCFIMSKMKTDVRATAAAPVAV